MFGKRKKIPEDELDMTPMVDVTFLLLIFFMVTAAFALQKSIEIPPKREDESARTIEEIDEDEDQIVVRVDADNVFWVTSPAQDEESEATSEQDLLAQLRAARRAGGRSGPSKLLVMAHGDARHEYVVRALDSGTAVGMQDVRLATVEDEDLE